MIGRSWAWAVGLGLAIGMATGCGGGGTQDFVIDNPLDRDAALETDTFDDGFDDGSGTGGGGGTTGAGDEGGDEGEDDGEDDGERDITEADIVTVEGDRLYALSTVSGLSVVDVSNPDAGLPVLGRYRMHADAFEMYVDGDQVLAITNDDVVYDQDVQTGAYTWYRTSRLLALDARDPSNIVLRGEFELSGRIQDSRRVGDVLYLVTFDDGACAGCPDQPPRTVVTSLDVSDPARVELVDQLAFDAEAGDPWDELDARSVSATDERMYLGGVVYASWNDVYSVIDVVDISDPSGMLAAGASLEIDGLIESRWQMDEYDGVLRVLTQPWLTGDPPVLETFLMASASDVVPLASLALTLPRPETLQSVRFDGPRGYAITFEVIDPLFTLDLSDPEDPRQVGELEIPGWIVHLEPRGDRVLALGYEPQNPEGTLNVSLFDVADPQSPALLSRVRFGAPWASFAEAQNRIHKAFTILDELDLVLVPYSGLDVGAGPCGTYRSGTQLVDWTDDALEERGVAPSRGRARRALVHRDRLLTLSDQAIQAFDITDRDDPELRAQAVVAVDVQDVAADGDLVVRLTSDWWSGEMVLEVVSSADPEAPQPLGQVALTEITNDLECAASWPVELLLRDGYAYLVRDTIGATTGRRLVLDTIDVNEPAAPAWLGAIDLPFSLGAGPRSRLGEHGLPRSIVRLDDALVFATSRWAFDRSGYVGSDGTLEVVDLSAPDAPMHVGTLVRPRALDLGALQVLDDTLVSWQMRPVADDPSKVRLYLDRFDVSSPAAPRALTPINVPGQVVAYDADATRAVVVGFVLEPSTARECASHPRYWRYDRDAQRCLLARRPLHLLALQSRGAVVLDTLELEGDLERLQTVVGADDRLFATIVDAADDARELAVILGEDGLVLDEASRVRLSQGGSEVELVGTAGRNALLTSDRALWFVDAADPADPEVTVAPTVGWRCAQPTVEGSTVYCPMDDYGLQALAVP